MKILVIVDVQNDFMPGGSLPVPDGDKIIPIINGMMDMFDVVVATQDWHPEKHISFASSHENKKPFDKWSHKEKIETLWPDHCVQGTHGAELHPDLNTNKIDAIIRKGTSKDVDSYSAFYDNNKEKPTGLSGFLDSYNWSTKVYVCGLAGDICVYDTMVDGLGDLFEMILIEDATKPIDKHNFELKKSYLTDRDCLIITSDEIDLTRVSEERKKIRDVTK